MELYLCQFFLLLVYFFHKCFCDTVSICQSLSFADGLFLLLSESFMITNWFSLIEHDENNTIEHSNKTIKFLMSFLLLFLRVITTSVPLFLPLAISILAPCLSIISFTIESPRPHPSMLLLLDLSPFIIGFKNIFQGFRFNAYTIIFYSKFYPIFIMKRYINR